MLGRALLGVSVARGTVFSPLLVPQRNAFTTFQPSGTVADTPNASSW